MIIWHLMVLQTNQLHKNYSLGSEVIPVLRGVDLQVEKGEFISIMGTSGSGKSTLLHILGGLDQPDQGTYFLNDRDMLVLSDRERSWIRAHWIGFVFQTFDLLPEVNVVENVKLPFLYNSFDDQTRDRMVSDAIEKVGLSLRKQHRPAEMSGGEMQRVAIARALAINPKLILADEPTGNLDNQNSREILKLFKELHVGGTTIVLVTHDVEVAATSQRVLKMENGCLS